MEELDDLFFGDGGFDALNDLDDLLDSVSVSNSMADEIKACFESGEPVRVFRWYHNSLDGGLRFAYLNAKKLVQKNHAFQLIERRKVRLNTGMRSFDFNQFQTLRKCVKLKPYIAPVRCLDAAPKGDIIIMFLIKSELLSTKIEEINYQKF